jgi:hypothetical protein
LANEDLLVIGDWKAGESRNDALEKSAITFHPTSKKRTYEVPVQNTSQCVAKDHPLVTVKELGESAPRLFTGRELRPASRRFEVQYVICAGRAVSSQKGARILLGTH